MKKLNKSILPETENRGFKYLQIFDDESLAPCDLGSLEVAVFSVSRQNNNKKNPKQEKTIPLDDLVAEGIEALIEILTHRRYGLPVVSDLTKYFGFLKIVCERFKFGQEIKNPIEFSCYELITKAGLTRRGGYKKDVHDWIKRMANTEIILTGKSLTKAGNHTEIHHIFDKVILSDTEDDKGNLVERNQIWLSDWTIQNITRRPLLPIDLNTYHKIKNDTAKLLITHLQSWLYGSRSSHYFQKDYGHFCKILNIKEHKYEWERNKQLDDIFCWLIKYEYVEKYELKPMKTKNGFKLLIWHGKKFYRDLDKAFTLMKNELPEDLPLQLPSSPKKTDESLSIENRIAALREDQRVFLDFMLSIPLFKSSAVELLEKTALPELKRKLAHAAEITDVQIAKGNVKKSERGNYIFGIINKDQVPNDFQTPEEREKKSEELTDRQKKEEEELFRQHQLEISWENYKTTEALKVFENMSKREREKLTTDCFDEIKKSSPNFGKFMTDEQLNAEKERIAISKLTKSEELLSFENFCQSDEHDDLIEKFYPIEQ